jgi:hypothetical protein
MSGLGKVVQGGQRIGHRVDLLADVDRDCCDASRHSLADE